MAFFQTGRSYSAEGQRIGWIVLAFNTNGTALVAFNDIDRGIREIMELPSAGGITDAFVLEAYDRCAYRRDLYLAEQMVKFLEGQALLAPTLEEQARAKRPQRLRARFRGKAPMEAARRALLVVKTVPQMVENGGGWFTLEFMWTGTVKGHRDSAEYFLRENGAAPYTIWHTGI